MEPSKEKSLLLSLARNKPWLFVMLSGVLLAASFPPSPLGPLSFIGFVPLFILGDALPEKLEEQHFYIPFKTWWMIFFRLITFQVIWNRGKSIFRAERKVISGNRQMFRFTYMAFFIWNFLCCYWLSLTVLEAEGFGDGIGRMMSGVLAVTVNPIFMSIPWQIYMRTKKWASPMLSAAFLLVFWIAFEFLHFRWELTWSWLTLGHALTTSPALLQYTEITGVLGASIYILVTNLLAYAVIRNVFEKKFSHIKLVSATAVWMLLPLVLNIFLLNPNREIFKPSGSLNVRIIQPNVPPEEKFNYLLLKDQSDWFVNLIQSKPLENIDLVILPETALAIPMDSVKLVHSKFMKPYWDLIDSTGVEILTGMMEERIFLPGQEIPASASLFREDPPIYRDTYNAATVLSPTRKISFYEKSKLVPIVERLPFLDFFTWLKNKGLDLTFGFAGYGIPDSLSLLHLENGTPVAVMICYESEFGDPVRRQTLMGAKLLTVVTNDGWWAKSSGYIQHSYWSVLRAIENRRSVTRAANTGRSMFVDNLGNISQPTSYWVQDLIDQKVNLYEGLTFYVRHGDYLGWICLFLSFGIVLYGITRKYFFKS